MKEYFARNRLWITPWIGGSLAATISVLLQAMGGPNVGTLPGWLPLVPFSFGTLGATIGAAHTNTTSANLVRFVGSAEVFAAVLYSMFR